MVQVKNDHDASAIKVWSLFPFAKTNIHIFTNHTECFTSQPKKIRRQKTSAPFSISLWRNHNDFTISFELYYLSLE